MISFLIGIITAAIVFYMSMIYGNAALALLGCFMCVFMVLTFIALLVKAHRAVAAINIPIAIATQGESIRVSLSCRLKEAGFYGVKYRVTVKNNLSGEKSTKWLSGGSDFLYSVNLCGNYEFELVRIKLYDISRLFYVTKRVKKYANVDFNEIHTTEEAKKLADEHHIEYEERHEKGDILNLFFEEYVEEHLIQPTFVMDHPIEISPLTKKKPEDPDYVERFEFFMNGWEMANAYSELNDPEDQRKRFEAQEALLAAGDEEANHLDEDFLNALAIGMPPTGGIGFGIDRMVMMMTNSPAIRDVLLFPTMKSLDK